VLEAQDGLAFEARDGQYFVVAPNSLRSRTSDEKLFTPYTQREIVKRLSEEFPESQGFDLLKTEHFFVLYTTSLGFAQWYGQLLEKLYAGFNSFWKEQGMTLSQSEFPMVAIVLSNPAKFLQYAQSEGFQLMRGQCAYYNKSTNRVVICDLSGLETYREGDKDRASTRDIQAFLNQPNAANNISAVIHEAVHLVGFSCGMHTRFAPNPLWLCEGLAVFHEVPDPGKKAGWSRTPKPNGRRLMTLKNYLQRNPPEPLQTMIRSDEPFNNVVTAADSYATAWGLTYYLAKRRPKELTAYLKKIQNKTILSEDSPDIRIQDFEDCFGNNWNKLLKDCIDYLRKL
ncbi:MAG: DUF1570 domain-containing protein, partial [Planctomycetaceae bacterium]|jgi:hypothetical protein|nr:DUF1570 domain-containing protein [Planctomycetaceae bacterium]